jgi:hypothetical protein
MKKVIFYLLIALSFHSFGQTKSLKSFNITDSFKVVSIDTVGKFYLVKCINDNGLKVLIIEDVPKHKVRRRNKKNPKLKKIQLGSSYNFKLKRHYSFGLSETGAVSIGKVEVWNKEKSDFDIFGTENLQVILY